MNTYRVNPFLTIYKKCNNGRNEDKYRLIKEGKLKTPRLVDIELTNSCNLKCRMCPTGIGNTGEKLGFMTDEVLESVCDNVIKYNIKGVRCVGWGEPTLHKNFWSIMQRLKSTGTLVHFNTNGMLLDESDIRRIVDYGIDSVKFSFQGADKESYEKMRVGGDWNKLIECLEKLIKVRGDRMQPFIQITTTLTNESKLQIAYFEDKVKDLCDYYNIGHTELSHLDIEGMKLTNEEKNELIELKKKETLEKRHFFPCPDAFDRFQVMWNGNVTLCCNDYGSGMVIGHVLEKDFQEIFTGNKADGFRRRIIEDGYDRIPMCKNCFEWAPLSR